MNSNVAKCNHSKEINKPRIVHLIHGNEIILIFIDLQIINVGTWQVLESHYVIALAGSIECDHT